MLITQSIFISSGCTIYQNDRVIKLYIPRTSALATVLYAENNTPYMYSSALATVLCAENNIPYMYSSALATVPSADNTPYMDSSALATVPFADYILMYYRYIRVGNRSMCGK